jgi:hypothetical protein
MNYWAHFATLLLGLIGTAIGIFATYQSNVANSQAKANADHLQTLQVQLQAASTFANGIHEARDALARSDTSGGIPAMVEVSRLYEVATTPQQKLVLIQIAQLSKQQAAMLALSTLVANDPELQSPAEGDRATVASIGRILRAATTQLAESATPPPAARPAPHKHGATRGGHPATPAPTPPPPADDPALTSSSNHLVAANAALVASLPKTEAQQGWVFAGDVMGWSPEASQDNARFIQYTSSLSSSVVPAPKQMVVACRDVNLRTVPLSNGSLGTVVGIAAQGTTLTVEKPPDVNPPVRSAIKTVSKVTGNHITARWIYVTIAAAPTKASRSTSAPPTPQSATACTEPAQVPSR